MANQDDTWDRMKTEDYENGTCWQRSDREPFRQFKDWYVVHVLVDTCADEHVCSPRDFEWIAIEPSRNPNLVSASGHNLKTQW